MASVSLKLKSQKTVFGTTVSMVSRNKDVDQVLAQNLDFDPLKNHKAKMDKGYLFRSPDITTDVWDLTAKERKKPLKAKVNKDGTITVKVKVTTLKYEA